MDGDEPARSTCGVLDLRQQLVRRSVWQWRSSPAAGVDGLLVAIGRRRGFGAAPAMMVVTRSGATDTTLAATRRHRCRSGNGDRRLRLVSLAPRSGGGAGGTERSPEFGSVNRFLCPHARGRARGRRR